MRSVGAQARAELLIPTKSFTLMGFLPFRLLFAFMRDILSSLIGHVARYAFVCKGTEVLSSAQRRLRLSFPLAAGAFNLQPVTA